MMLKALAPPPESAAKLSLGRPPLIPTPVPLSVPTKASQDCTTTSRPPKPMLQPPSELLSFPALSLDREHGKRRADRHSHPCPTRERRGVLRRLARRPTLGLTLHSLECCALCR